MPGAPPPSEPRASPEAWDCLIQSIQSFINRTRASLRLARARQEKPLACFALQSAAFGVLPRAVWALSLRARACAGPRRHALAVHRGRAGVQWRVAACKCVVRSWCNVLCNVVQMWPVWCRACVYDGRSVITRFAPRVCTRERAGSRLLEGGVLLCFGWCCVPMFGGAQHFNLHRCVHTAARVLPVRIAAAAGARGSRHRVAWQPGQ